MLPKHKPAIDISIKWSQVPAPRGMADRVPIIGCYGMGIGIRLPASKWSNITVGGDIWKWHCRTYKAVISMSLSDNQTSKCVSGFSFRKINIQKIYINTGERSGVRNSSYMQRSFGIIICDCTWQGSTPRLPATMSCIHLVFIKCNILLIYMITDIPTLILFCPHNIFASWGFDY